MARKRVVRLMRERGINAQSKRRRMKTTDTRGEEDAARGSTLCLSSGERGVALLQWV